MQKALIMDCVDNDQFLTDWIDAHGPRLTGWALSKYGEQSSDWVQEAFIKVWQMVVAGERREDYLMGAARNEVRAMGSNSHRPTGQEADRGRRDPFWGRGEMHVVPMVRSVASDEGEENIWDVPTDGGLPQVEDRLLVEEWLSYLTPGERSAAEAKMRGDTVAEFARDHGLTAGGGGEKRWRLAKRKLQAVATKPVRPGPQPARGVSWDSSRRRWRVQTHRGGKQIWSGGVGFKNVEDANALANSIFEKLDQAA